MYAGVVIDRTARAVDRVFDYLVPEVYEREVTVGVRVRVHIAGSPAVGVVTELKPTTAVPEGKLHPIEAVLPGGCIVRPEFIEYSKWLARTYDCTLSEALRQFMPVGLRDGKSDFKTVTITLADRSAAKAALESKRIGKAMRSILRIMLDWERMPRAKLLEKSGAGAASLKGLIEKGILAADVQTEFKDIGFSSVLADKEHKLTALQQTAYDAIANALDKGRGRFLLYGVTGSGKTEVYIRAVEKAVALGKQAIVLVPEIGLTPQMLARFKSRFGSLVAVTHSRLSERERLNQWQAARDGAAQIMIGPRSAVFAPFNNLGLIIMDECHDHSYNSDRSPRMRTEDFAALRAVREGAVLVLGSATPSVEQFYAAERGAYTVLSLPERVNRRAMPRVTVVDMRNELKNGNIGMLSGALYQALKNTLDRHEQAILLMNRRGYNNFVSCRSCGESVKCPDCDVAMTYHKRENILKCHYCGKTLAVPHICPSCGSRYIKGFGIGTETVEEVLRQTFPGVRVLRMDQDTTTAKDSHTRLLESFTAGEADILLGTQMVAKGLDVENVTLVGVIAADTALNVPDYRGAELCFQLVAQVAGRAGRGSREGCCVIQTYQPEHEAVVCAAAHDYMSFYRGELRRRQHGFAPPFAHIARIGIRGETAEACEAAAQAVKSALEADLAAAVDVRGLRLTINACEAPIGRIKAQYRYHVLLRFAADRRVYEVIHSSMRNAAASAEREFERKGLLFTVDFYPDSLL